MSLVKPERTILMPKYGLRWQNQRPYIYIVKTFICIFIKTLNTLFVLKIKQILQMTKSHNKLKKNKLKINKY